MNNGSYVMDLNSSWQVKKVERTREQRRWQNYIESRLKALGNLITSIVEAPAPFLLSEDEWYRDAIDDLVAKEARLRWIVRVAKYSEGACKTAMWHEAEKALTELERTAHPLMHVKCA